MDASDPAAVTQAEFARRLGVTRQYVHQLVKRKVIALRDGLINFAEAVRAIEAAQDPARPRTRPKITGDEPATYQAARAMKERYIALSRKLEYERACRRLLTVDEVVFAWQQIISAFRARTLAIPSRLAPQLVMIHDRKTVQAILTAEVRKTLQELSGFDLASAAPAPQGRRDGETAGANGKSRRITPVH
jgi:hypothetical protein